MNDETTKKAVDNLSEGDDFELRPHYNFSKGVRGKYAGRFTQGLQVEHFPEHAQADATKMLEKSQGCVGNSTTREMERLECLLLKIEQLTHEPLSSQQALAIRQQTQIALDSLRAYRQSHDSA